MREIKDIENEIGFSKPILWFIPAIGWLCGWLYVVKWCLISVVSWFDVMVLNRALIIDEFVLCCMLLVVVNFLLSLVFWFLSSSKNCAKWSV